MQKLISIVTPTYNCGHLINRLLDSILWQTYSNIEMFIIDDGSTDNTKEIIENYIPKFDNKNYLLYYKYQKNGGNSSALNNGIKLASGYYLVWPDADDYYTEQNSLEVMATTLDKTSNEVSCIRCSGYFFDESNFKIHKKIKLNNKEDLFEDCLFKKRYFINAPIIYMVKNNILFKEIPDRNIYTEKDAGQNYQILLPVLYNYKCVTINDYLVNILVRKDSTSRKKRTFEQLMNRNNAIYRTIIATLKNIKNMPDEERYFFNNNIEKIFTEKLFMACFVFGKHNDAKIYFKKMKEKYENISNRIKLCHAICFIPFYFIIYSVLKKCKNIVVFFLNRISLTSVCR